MTIEELVSKLYHQLNDPENRKIDVDQFEKIKDADAQRQHMEALVYWLCEEAIVSITEALDCSNGNTIDEIATLHIKLLVSQLEQAGKFFPRDAVNEINGGVSIFNLAIMQLLLNCYPDHYNEEGQEKDRDRAEALQTALEQYGETENNPHYFQDLLIRTLTATDDETEGLQASTSGLYLHSSLYYVAHYDLTLVDILKLKFTDRPDNNGFTFLMAVIHFFEADGDELIEALDILIDSSVPNNAYERDKYFSSKDKRGLNVVDLCFSKHFYHAAAYLAQQHNTLLDSFNSTNITSSCKNFSALNDDALLSLLDETSANTPLTTAWMLPRLRNTAKSVGTSAMDIQKITDLAKLVSMLSFSDLSDIKIQRETFKQCWKNLPSEQKPRLLELANKLVDGTLLPKLFGNGALEKTMPQRQRFAVLFGGEPFSKKISDATQVEARIYCANLPSDDASYCTKKKQNALGLLSKLEKSDSDQAGKLRELLAQEATAVLQPTTAIVNPDGEKTIAGIKNKRGETSLKGKSLKGSVRQAPSFKMKSVKKPERSKQEVDDHVHENIAEESESNTATSAVSDAESQNKQSDISEASKRSYSVGNWWNKRRSKSKSPEKERGNDIVVSDFSSPPTSP
jgi:hypothetical protein